MAECLLAHGAIASAAAFAAAAAAAAAAVTHLTRVDWIARNTPKIPVNHASDLMPATADTPEMARAPRGTFNDGSGTTVLLLVVLREPFVAACTTGTVLFGAKVIGSHAVETIGTKMQQ
jgi:hypothetical protein